MNIEKILQTVHNEMKPSMGCTEPVAIGLAVSNTCQSLTKPATKLKLKVSSNIFKNAYCVKIPNTTEAGIPLAATLGYLLTKQGNTMEIFTGVNGDLVKKAYELIKKQFVEIEAMSSMQFYIEVWAENDSEKVHTLTVDMHDNLVLVEKNGEVLLDKRQPEENGTTEDSFDITQYTVAQLVELAQTIDLEKITFLRAARDMNVMASQAGLAGDYGMNIGKSIKKMMDEGIVPKDLQYYVKMVVTAASDCRMGGGAYSAMTVLGSGNQGFQATLPAIAAAEFLNKDEETMLRGMFMAILVTIRQKYKVGRLSPVCGATLSGTASAAAITWMLGGNIKQIEGAMKTMYANLTGMMCDGAKDGCAMKLCTCSGEAVMAARLAMCGSMASKTDGIVAEKVEDCIDNVARLSKEGMKAVDMNVIEIMMAKEL
ncbi:MAG: L-serine ammonia-lyase, iron-sulfur-dependent, subunit alpha [Oscillospiraceae bacterium]